MINTRQQAEEVLQHFSHITEEATVIKDTDYNQTVAFKIILQGFRYAMSEVKRLEREAGFGVNSDSAGGTQISQPQYRGDTPPGPLRDDALGYSEGRSCLS
jgi:hypothetical protein